MIFLARFCLCHLIFTDRLAFPNNLGISFLKDIFPVSSNSTSVKFWHSGLKCELLSEKETFQMKFDSVYYCVFVMLELDNEVAWGFYFILYYLFYFIRNLNIKIGFDSTSVIQICFICSNL